MNDERESDGNLDTRILRCEREFALSDDGIGGAERDRTVDLLSAIQALSQLSYSPTWREASAVNGSAPHKIPPQIIEAQCSWTGSGYGYSTTPPCLRRAPTTIVHRIASAGADSGRNRFIVRFTGSTPDGAIRSSSCS